jgi:DNA-binding beta-propeller fold protein YncE
MRYSPSSAPSPCSRARAVPAALLLAALALSGCATASGAKAPDVVWPLPPDPPRIKFVRAFAREGNLSTGALKTTLRALIPGSPEAVIQNPTGLALSLDEKVLYVACANASRVLAMDLEGGGVRLVANVEGRRPSAPFGIAVDAEGALYVTDARENAVWVYDRAGAFLRRIGKDVLQHPTHLALDRRRQVLYVTSGTEQASEAHRIEVLSLKGEHLRTIGARGAGPGQFNFPQGLTVGTDGNLYVVDMLNFRVQVFDPDGQLLGMFGSIGAGQPGTFDKAKGIALDAFGNIYVSDSQQAYVQIFNPRYQPLMGFGGRAGVPGYMSLPTAVAIDSRNTIYVADYGANLVNEYQLINTTAEDSFEPGQEPPGAPPTTAPGAVTPSQKPQDG